ncbi:MAG: hypothetical protein IJM85_07640 [Clostridia bacterium]|nr:hypothetical protein [Clostridia bacterium]
MNKKLKLLCLLLVPAILFLSACVSIGHPHGRYKPLSFNHGGVGDPGGLSYEGAAELIAGVFSVPVPDELEGEPPDWLILDIDNKGMTGATVFGTAIEGHATFENDVLTLYLENGVEVRFSYLRTTAMLEYAEGGSSITFGINNN